MIFDLLLILPQVFTIGNDILKCLDGDVTQDEWDAVVEDLYGITVKVPQLQGFLAVIDIISNLAKASYPYMEKMLEDAKTDPGKLKGVHKRDISEADMIRAKNAIALMGDLKKKFTADRVDEPAPVAHIDFDEVIKGE